MQTKLMWKCSLPCRCHAEGRQRGQAKGSRAQNVGPVSAAVAKSAANNRGGNSQNTHALRSNSVGNGAKDGAANLRGPGQLLEGGGDASHQLGSLCRNPHLHHHMSIFRYPVHISFVRYPLHWRLRVTAIRQCQSQVSCLSGLACECALSSYYLSSWSQSAGLFHVLCPPIMHQEKHCTSKLYWEGG